ncbi:MAG: HNH endonuclease [Proteobacteria bacterium]|nr:HNH endonuclease [Pseudomonadota bacterium]
MRSLPITGEYPADWKQISDAIWAAAGHRCVRCLHPYRKGEHGKGEWTPCDERCTHTGPFGYLSNGVIIPLPHLNERTAQYAAEITAHYGPLIAQWRIGTVHHLDGNKANCVWWNLLALCQRCHLTIQSRVNPQQPYWLEHSDWFKPYVAGFYAKKYEGRDVSREEAEADLDRLLALERLA